MPNDLQEAQKSRPFIALFSYQAHFSIVVSSIHVHMTEYRKF